MTTTPMPTPHLFIITGMDGTGRLSAPLIDALARRRHPYDVHVIALNDFISADGDPRFVQSAAHLSGEILRRITQTLAQTPDAPVVLVAESYASLAVHELLVTYRAQGGFYPCHIRAVVFIAGFLVCPSPIAMLAGRRPVRWLIPYVLRSLAYLLNAKSTHRLCQRLVGRVAFGRDAHADFYLLFAQALHDITQPHLLPHIGARLHHIAHAQLSDADLIGIDATLLQASDDVLVNDEARAQFIRQYRYCNVITLQGTHFLAQTNADGVAAVLERLAMMSP